MIVAIASSAVQCRAASDWGWGEKKPRSQNVVKHSEPRRCGDSAVGSFSATPAVQSWGDQMLRFCGVLIFNRVYNCVCVSFTAKVTPITASYMQNSLTQTRTHIKLFVWH